MTTFAPRPTCTAGASLGGTGSQNEVEIAGQSWRRRVRWHSASDIGSAAFWVEQTRRSRFPATYRLGATLAEEVAACLLGGYGITGPMTIAAFEALRTRGLLRLEPAPSRGELESVLREPVEVAGHARPIRYRFAAQRALRLADALAALREADDGDGLAPRELRAWLTQLPGVGPKTASWVVRNVSESDEIAIIDIHIHRAGLVAGVFDPGWRLPRDYQRFEEAFCAWAEVGGVRTADLDACIWNQMAAHVRNGHSPLSCAPR